MTRPGQGNPEYASSKGPRKLRIRNIFISPRFEIYYCFPWPGVVRYRKIKKKISKAAPCATPDRRSGVAKQAGHGVKCERNTTGHFRLKTVDDRLLGGALDTCYRLHDESLVKHTRLGRPQAARERSVNGE